MIFTYEDLILVIPKIPTDRLRELIAYMRLEIARRGNDEASSKGDSAKE